MADQILKGPRNSLPTEKGGNPLCKRLQLPNSSIELHDLIRFEIPDGDQFSGFESIDWPSQKDISVSYIEVYHPVLNRPWLNPTS